MTELPKYSLIDGRMVPDQEGGCWVDTHDLAEREQAQAAEVARLTMELEKANNEFGSQTAAWPNLWRRIAQLKELSGERYRRAETAEAEVARLREAHGIIETDAAAQWLMNWLDALADPFAVALAIAQAEEAHDKCLDVTGHPEAAKTARVRRFLESIAIGNAKLLRSLTPPR